MGAQLLRRFAVRSCKHGGQMNAATVFSFFAMKSVRSTGIAQQVAAIKRSNEPSRPRPPLVLGGIDESKTLLVDANEKLRGGPYK